MVCLPYEACDGLAFLIWQVIVAFEEARLDSRLAARSLREAYRVKREAQLKEEYKMQVALLTILRI